MLALDQGDSFCPICDLWTLAALRLVPQLASRKAFPQLALHPIVRYTYSLLPRDDARLVRCAVIGLRLWRNGLLEVTALAKCGASSRSNCCFAKPLAVIESSGVRLSFLKVAGTRKAQEKRP